MLDLTTFEQSLQQRMTEEQVPGFAIAVIKNQEVVYAKGLGVTSVEEGGLPVTSEAVFRVASCTKPLTATALMKLVQEGVLDLDRPIIEYVPWIRFNEPGAAERVTLRMLLKHTAGLDNGGATMGRRDPEGLADYVRHQIPQVPLVAPPGKAYSYGNHSYNLAGYVAEAVTGERFSDLMERVLFKALRMNRATFDPLIGLTYPMALSHERQGDGSLRAVRPFFENLANYPSAYAMATILQRGWRFTLRP